MNRKYIYPVLVLIISLAFYFLNDAIDQNQETTKTENSDLVKKSNKYYLPESTTNQIVHHQFYSLSYNEPYEQAEWVAYELRPEHLSRNDFNRPYFEIDKEVKTKAAHWRNYKNSGYSRGHLCPAADRKFSKVAFVETFLTSNISPQKQDFNSGIWNTLEQKVRYWAKKYNGVYIITGGVLTDGLRTIGKENVAVPAYFYKIVFNESKGEMKALAFLIPHENTQKALYTYVVSIDKLEALTGIDFFSQLPDEQEDQLERKSDYKQWIF